MIIYIKELFFSPYVKSNVLFKSSTTLGKPEWEVIEILSHPHGLKRLIKGEYVLEKNKLSYNTQEQRLETALSLVVMYEQFGISMDLINREVRKLLDRLERSRDFKRGKTDSDVAREDTPDNA